MDAFDYTTPFRAMLADIARVLGQDARIDLRLPAIEKNEDFIEGTLQFGASVLRVYYGHSLSYLTLSIDDESTLCDIAKRIQPLIALIS